MRRPSSTSWTWSQLRVSPGGTWLAAPVSLGEHGRSWDLLLTRRSGGSASVVELGAASGEAIVHPQLPEFASDDNALFAVGNSDVQTSVVVIDLSAEQLHARAFALPAGPAV